MPELTLTVNSRNYDVACGEGEEPHLRTLAEFIDSKITAIVGKDGRRGDTRLLLMATLLIADELSDAYAELETLKSGGKGAAAAAAAETRMGESLEKLSERIESIAESLERS